MALYPTGGQSQTSIFRRTNLASFGGTGGRARTSVGGAEDSLRGQAMGQMFGGGGEGGGDAGGGGGGRERSTMDRIRNLATSPHRRHADIMARARQPIVQAVGGEGSTAGRAVTRHTRRMRRVFRRR